jgi:hypothetical protein
MSRDDQQGKQNSKHRARQGGEQAQWIRDVRSGLWQVTMLEVKKGHTRRTILFGWLNVEIMRRQVSN